MTTDLPYTPELLLDLAKAMDATTMGTPWDAEDIRSLVGNLHRHHLRLVDARRERHCIDERVYTSALERCHAAEKVASDATQLSGELQQHIDEVNRRAASKSEAP